VEEGEAVVLTCSCSLESQPTQEARPDRAHISEADSSSTCRLKGGAGRQEGLGGEVSQFVSRALTYNFLAPGCLELLQ
jgi:hypothetical protein